MNEDMKRIEGRVDSLHIKFDAVIKELAEWKMQQAERMVKLEQESAQNKLDVDSAHRKIRECEKVCTRLGAGGVVMSWVQKAAVIVVPVLMYLNWKGK